MATTAAILEIAVQANTGRASSELRRMNTTLGNTAKAGTTATQATDRFGRSVGTARRQSTAAVRGTDRLAESSGRLSGVVGTAAKAAIGLGAAYVGLSAAKQAVTATTDLAKSTLTLKKGFGLSIRTASEFGAVLKARGADASSVGMAFNTLSRQVEAAKDGSETATKSFKALGISQQELKNSSPDRLLFQISDGMNQLGRGTERTAATSALFGRGWKTIGPVLRSGSADLREQLDLADKYGASFGGKPIKSIQDLIATERELQIAQLGLQVQFTEKIAPSLITMGLALADVIKWTQGAVHWAGQASKDFAHWTSTTGTLAETFRKIIKVLIDVAKFEYKVGQAAIQAGKWVGNAFGNIIGAGKNVINWFRNAWGNLKDVIAAPFSKAVGTVRGFINDIIGIINTVLGPIGVHIGEVGGGSGSKKPVGVSGPKPNKKQKGGIMVPGSGSGDKVPAMLEPGEFVLNRNAVAAIGPRELAMFNDSVPRFAVGGAVGSLPSKAVGVVSGVVPELPGVSSLPDWIKPGGEFVLDKVSDFIKKKLASVGPDLSGPNIGAANGLQQGIRNILAVVLGNTSGLSISSGLRPGDSGSFHSLGRAVDLSGSPEAMLTAASWIDKHLAPVLTEGIHNPNLSVDSGQHVSPGFWGASTWAGHVNHIHLAKQRGGIIQKLQKGGTAQPGTTSEGHDLYRYFQPFGYWANSKHFPFSPDSKTWETMLQTYAIARNNTDRWDLSARKMVKMHRNPRKDPYQWLAKWRNWGRAQSGYQRGGIVQRFARGGRVGKLQDPRLNQPWPWDGTGTLEPWVIAAIFEAAGLPGITFSQVAHGESSFQPGAVGHDPGGTLGLGLAQITTGYNSDIIRRFGGNTQMLNPWKNAQAAKAVWERQGPSAWVGTQYVTGWNQHYTGKRFNVKNLGGAAAKAPKVKRRKKKKGKTGVGEVPEIDTSTADAISGAYAALVEGYVAKIGVQNTRIGSANELIRAMNLTAMQRYQVGVAQNPLLGLGRPGKPIPQALIPLLSSIPDQATLLGFLQQANPPVAAGPVSGAYDVKRKKKPGKKMRGGVIGSYAEGGVVPGPVGAPQAAIVHGGETIIPPGGGGDTHVYFMIDGRQIEGTIKKVQKRATRGGNRPLPSAGGGG